MEILKVLEVDRFDGITFDSRPVIRVLFICMSALIVLGVAGQVCAWFFGHDHLLGFVPGFDLSGENNVPAWFSTICLFLCAIVLAAIARSEWRKGVGLWRYWNVLAWTFVLLSLDEAASFHEELVAPLRAALHTDGFLYFAWVVPGSLFAFGFLLAFLKFLSQLPPETARGFLVAGSIYCSGCLGMEMLGGKYLSLYGADFILTLLAVVEEALEMAGVILFLRSLLGYVANHIGNLTVRVQGHS